LKWLEVSLIANGEIAEAAADVLARHAPAGLALEPMDAEVADKTSAASIRVRAFLPVDEQLEARRASIEEGLWHLSQIMPIPEPTFQQLEEENWTESWKAGYRPMPIGGRLLIQPSWLPLAEDDRSVIIIDPGQAFGTGAHPSTRLCLTALVEHLLPGDVVFDLGCGSGILSIAAARLGAANVRAVDIDPLAVEATTENVSRNGVESVVKVELGSLGELLVACEQERTCADILLANILASVLDDLLHAGLADSVKPGGKIILSGVLNDQAKSLIESAQEAGLSLQQVIKETDWQALVMTRKTAPN
jgi:ribosomal protein L11 methyltransferase